MVPDCSLIPGSRQRRLFWVAGGLLVTIAATWLWAHEGHALLRPEVFKWTQRKEPSTIGV